MWADTFPRIFSESIALALLLSAPFLLAAWLLGLALGVFSLATQLRDPAMTYVPKVFLMAVVLVATGSWMAGELMRFTLRLFRMLHSG